MRRLLQYVWAALAGGFLGGLFAESGQLLGMIIGAGVAVSVLLFVHVYPRVGYAEQRMGPPGSDRRFNS